MSCPPLTLENHTRYTAGLQLCISLFGLWLVYATWPLWWPAGEYPVVPWFEALRGVPLSLDRLLALGIVASGVGNAWLSGWALSGQAGPADRHQQLGTLIVRSLWLVCLAGSVMLDQQRFQVWASEFFWLTLFLSLASPQVAGQCCRVLVIGIYAYSALSKLDLSFAQHQGPWLWQGLRRAVGLETMAWGTGSDWGILLFPLGELLVAGLLCCSRWRCWGVVGSWGMHLTLLLALGPLGWNQRPGVLLWNVFFLVSVPLLFLGERAAEGLGLRAMFRFVKQSCSSQPSTSPPIGRGDHFCILAVCALCVWPAFEGFGGCDHWPAWAVYSSRPEIVSIHVSQDEIALLPPSLRKHVGPPEPLSEWCPISIDQWSFEVRNSPTYPQARYRLAIARHLASTGGVRLRVIEQSMPNRWTGMRESREIDDLEADLHDRFWFNTQSRSPVPRPPLAFGDHMIAHTAQFSVACYAIALLLSAGRSAGSRPTRAVASFWTAGPLGLAVHMASAFHFLHHWSHAAALKHTAQRTAEVTGWDWPGGLYINYAFLLFWAFDAVRVWREALGRTSIASPIWRRFVHGVFLFMMFNATVVFGPWHWSVAGVVFAILWWLAWRGRDASSEMTSRGVPLDAAISSAPGSPVDDRPE